MAHRGLRAGRVRAGEGSRHACVVLRAPQHWENPYPNKNEKQRLSAEAMIGVAQVRMGSGCL